MSMPSITCEISPPKDRVCRRCAGLFTQDQRGNIFLPSQCQDRRGRPGIGKRSFLAHRKSDDIASVAFPNGEAHDYIILGRIDHPLLRRVADFFQSFPRETIEMSSRADVLGRIKKFNHGRDPERLARKYRAMQKDALAFFRGTCHLFCSDWPRSGVVDDAPLVWVCGDLHIENFGTYKGDNRLVYFDIADFDEGLLATCDWDLTRLATSILIAADVYGLRGKLARAFVDTLLDSYRSALIDGKARWIERALARGLVGRIIEQLERRTRKSFVEKRIERRSGKVALRIDCRHALDADGPARRRIKQFMKEFAAAQTNPLFFKFVDVARRIAGTGSLGLERYTILINGRGPPSGFYLLDLKLAVGSALSKFVNVPQPRWESEADRIVSIERRMQAISPALTPGGFD